MSREVIPTAPIEEWLSELKRAARQKRLVILRFSAEDWESISSSKRGTNKFTFARNHQSFQDIRAPAACVLLGTENGRAIDTHFGLLATRNAVTTLETRVKVACSQRIAPYSEVEILDLITDHRLKELLRSRLSSGASVIGLPAATGVHLVESLAQNKLNHWAMRAVANALKSPSHYSSNLALQEDAIGLSLQAFGMPRDSEAAEVEINMNRQTGLAGIPIREDAVIEHDAGTIPGFDLRHRDLTGLAVFRNNAETLEVVTANRRPLEEVFGVDLIYLNTIKRNIVMLQYKMLERLRHDGETDWLFRPDKQFQREIMRMTAFRKSQRAGALEYRLNPEVFYLRFVRRDAALGKQTITMPIDHFETIRNDPRCTGPRGAFRISYNTLAGRYMRQVGFLDLLRSGYIGAYAEKTEDLANLVARILSENRALIASVHSRSRIRR